jgi:hypothetical protein
MAIYGSSRISFAPSSLIGPTGSIGATGATGATGETGPQGPLGFTGYGITAAIGTGGGSDDIGYEIIFTLAGYVGETYGGVIEAGTTLGVTAVRGGTGEDKSEDFHILNTVGINGIDYGVGYGELFKEKIGITAHFRNLTISGRDISIIQPTDYMIMLGGSTSDYGRMGNTGELLYINPELGGLSAQGAPNTFWSGDQLTARILTHRETFDDSGTYNNFPAEVDNEAGLPTNVSDVVSTSNLDGTAVTFSSIFVDPFHSDPTGIAIASGIHFGGDSLGEIYKFAGVTFDSKYSVEDNLIGSCCYCSSDANDHNSIGCVDYITKPYCDAIQGNFSSNVCLNRSSDETCYSGDACCVNGICVETSEHKCNIFGGFYISGIKCLGPDGVEGLGDPNTETGCPEPCGIRGACCVNNECYELTELECSFSPNSMWFNKPCEGSDFDPYIEGTNCCLEANVGACCVDEVCFHSSAHVCTQLVSQVSEGQPSYGVFWGIGSRCAGMNIALPGTYSDNLYYPYNCVNALDELQGILGDDGKCSNGSLPPCSGCPGWTQLMPDGGSCGNLNIPAEACLCPNINCPCEPGGTPSYTCYDNDSCGTIILVDGTCWECCKNQPIGDEASLPIGSCCIYNGVNYDCKSLNEEDCLSELGYFNNQSCLNINCDSGACCHIDGWCEPNTTIGTCNGTWIPGDCGTSGNPCDLYRAFDESELKIPQMPSSTVPKSGSGKRKSSFSRSRPTRLEGRKTIDRPDAKQECPTSTNIPSCITPGIAIPPMDNNQWIIDVGCGECSCCCPGVCWKGALGSGGIVNDCKELGERCYQTLDCSNNQCVSNPNESYPVDSVPNVLPLCIDIEWESNEFGCVPYVDTSDPDNPIWMVCSCCCVGSCIEYTDPIACSECESRGSRGSQCVCVGGCDDCF